MLRKWIYKYVKARETIYGYVHYKCSIITVIPEHTELLHGRIIENINHK